jgi:8-amino-7-oxononanoate synthase
MNPAGWDAWMRDSLAEIRGGGRWRSLRSFDALGPTGMLDGRQVVSFASNDYLGLSAHPAVIAAAVDAVGTWGTGATASRLVVGHRPVHAKLEEALAAWKQTERALVFSTGFAANVSTLAVLGGRDVTVFSDELNHASIIDGCRLSGSRVVVYPHNDLAALAEQLPAANGRCLVVTDSVFSMDGDEALATELVALCAEHDALLVLDEAHSVMGPHLDGPTPSHVVRVGTLSKTLGSMGGFVAASGPVVDLMINRGRPFIFSTGLTPADAAAGLAALHVLESAEGDALVARLRSIVERVAPGHPSPIVPILIGDEAEAVRVAAAVLERGLLIPAIRPPTVAPGTSRLRLALSAAHTDSMIDELLAVLADVLPGVVRAA